MIQFSVIKVNDNSPGCITQEFVDELVQIGFAICNMMGKVTLSALCILSIITHINEISFEKYFYEVFKLFQSGVDSDDAMVQKETSRAVGDYANILPNQSELQSQLFELTLKVLTSQTLEPN